MSCTASKYLSRITEYTPKERHQYEGKMYSSNRSGQLEGVMGNRSVLHQEREGPVVLRALDRLCADTDYIRSHWRKKNRTGVSVRVCLLHSVRAINKTDKELHNREYCIIENTA